MSRSKMLLSFLEKVRLFQDFKETLGGTVHVVSVSFATTSSLSQTETVAI